MRIIQIYDSSWDEKVYPPAFGGVTSHIFYTCKHLARMGHQVTIVERRIGPDDPERAEIEGVEFIRLNARKLAPHYWALPRDPFGPLRFAIESAAFALKANKVIHEIRPDIVHVHRLWAASILLSMNRGLRKRAVYTAHMGQKGVQIDVRKGPLLARLLPVYWPYIYLTRRPYLVYHYLMRRVQKVVVLNEDLRSMLIASAKINPEDIVAVPAGADTETFHPGVNTGEVKEKYRLRGMVTVLFAGTVIPRKGVRHLVKAIGEVVRSFPNVVLLIAGDLKLNEGYVKEIDELIETHGLQDHARLLGYLEMEELKKLYAACDIFVSPSLDEGFTAVLTEAMCSGKPLVGTRVGGADLQIRDGWNGFLVEPANEEQLTQKLAYLVQYPKRRCEMGRNSRTLAEEKFDWGKMAEKLEVIYRDVSLGRTG